MCVPQFCIHNFVLRIREFSSYIKKTISEWDNTAFLNFLTHKEKYESVHIFDFENS